MKKIYFSFLLAILFLVPYTRISAQEENLFDDGTVWTMTFIRIDANRDNDYLKGLSNTWVSSMEEAKKQGLIVDYKILQGPAANKEDFNLVLMVENKAMGNFDPDKEREAKFDAIQKSIKDKMGDEFQKTVTNYADMREMMGTKMMREIHLKK